ncbi:tail fiber protein [Flavobacterium sp. KACC 22758]|uniref:tail fiber protein n=1 Tax=Flavobacterium sp. KACC 22758 TaxID=3025667 RepID=UPI0023650E71|nr:tail fiber protein [Flavobacterium sp. KACC 22758]WDF60823.1 tail fiber protein [Flavobacterium sp. KACC 22758]
MRLLDNSISIGIVSSTGAIKETICKYRGRYWFWNKFSSKLYIARSLTLDGGISNTLPRPLITAGTLANGEIRSYGGGGNFYDDGFLRLSAGGGTNVDVKSYIDLSGYSTIPDMNRNIVFGTSGTERMRIDVNGNIAIGSKSPDAKLTVNGTIHSSEVKVDLNFSAPDYVFTNDYKLRSLKEVEKYIKENSHLPEIPSAKEFEKNGINVSEMNMALLKKVEELTLYSIEQQKNTEKLNLYIDKQQKKYDELILQLKKQNDRLEKLEKMNNN